MDCECMPPLCCLVQALLANFCAAQGHEHHLALGRLEYVLARKSAYEREADEQSPARACM